VWFHNKKVGWALVDVKKHCNPNEYSISTLLLVFFYYAATCLDEDSAGGGALAEQFLFYFIF